MPPGSAAPGSNAVRPHCSDVATFVPFCQGLPGSMSAVSSPFATAQRRIAFETNSEPYRTQAHGPLLSRWAIDVALQIGDRNGSVP